MQLKFICPRWGSEDLEFSKYIDKVVSAGYHGVEFSLPQEKKLKNEWLELIKSNDLI